MSDLDFKFFMPTAIYSGKGCVLENSEVFANYGKRALIVTGKSSAVNGALEDVTYALGKQNISYDAFDKCVENPTLSSVRECAAQARRSDAQFIVAIGGGSPMDTAKAAAMLARQDYDDGAVFGGVYGDDILPMLHVPTTAGTGSEVTQYSIITNDAIQSKKNISHVNMFPKVAFLDATYTKGLPRPVAVNTVLDALCHAAEGVMSVKSGVLSNLLALEALSIIGERLELLNKRDVDFEDRQQLLYASCLAGMVIAQTGTCAVHALGYPLTYFHNLPHGRANALMLAAFLDACSEECGAEVKKILSALDVKSTDKLASIITALLGGRDEIGEKQIKAYAEKVKSNKNVFNCKHVLSVEELEQILSASVKAV